VCSSAFAMNLVHCAASFSAQPLDPKSVNARIWCTPGRFDPVLKMERSRCPDAKALKIKPFLYPQRVNCGKLLQHNTKLERMHV
jgi:hypothetical protein